jgi:hypothetical protein
MPQVHLCRSESLSAFTRPALVAGHPGHELKVFGWITQQRPLIYLLTDGSGGLGVSRVPASAELIRRLGTWPGEVFGAISDTRIYQAILEKKAPFFLEIVNLLADSFVRHGVDFVAADAVEGFNPTHDICRPLVAAAILMAERHTGKTIAHYDVRLTEWERKVQDMHDDQCLHLVLDNELLREKLAAAEEYLEMRDEVNRAVNHFGRDYFGIECMRKVTHPFVPPWGTAKPFYECRGEQQVASGKYRDVLRFQEHMLPLMDAISEYAASAASTATQQGSLAYR